MKTRHVTRRKLVKMLAAATIGYPFLAGAKKSVRDLAELDLAEASRAVRDGSFSPIDLTRACLKRIERYNSRLNAFITISADRALAEARAAEDEIRKGHWRGPLHGIPIALKDNIDTAGVRTTAASAVFAERVPTEDADVTRRLKEAGAVFLGKLNMHEFALGTTAAISHFGPVHNPWDLERIVGGSSGGTGAAVAASLCFGAVGTDTGGSNRIPAACCGVVGLKPTYGIVSTRGVIPVSNSFDHVGPMCRTVADTALLFRAITDHRVAKEIDSPTDLSRLRLGVIKAPRTLCDDTPIDPEVQAAVEAAIDVIRPLIGSVHDVELPDPEKLGRLIDYESYAFHAQHLAHTPERYDTRTLATILDGKEISEAEGAQLRRDLEEHRAKVRKAFGHVDLVTLPTLPTLPLRIRDADQPFAQPACTFAFSLGGLPAMSVPCGYSRSGLPIGLMIGGPPLSEKEIFALARAYESAKHWRRRQPPL